MVTRSTEDYLKHIYELRSKGSKVNTTTLAGVLNISPPSVSEMIQKLTKTGWIKNTPYHGFSLTKKGERIAINLIRKHRLIESFLYQHLGYTWDEVHAEAEKFEHVCSEKFINKLDEYLSYPRFDPHGDPIPDINGSISDKDSFILSDGNAGNSYLVCKVNDTSDEVLKYISSIGIKLNSEIAIDEKISFDESVLISMDNGRYLLSKKIADNIFVLNIESK
jgi:DtxR family transcriptional regulator, Mn-dependent transcriptional regulator